MSTIPNPSSAAVIRPLRGILLVLCAGMLWGTTGTAQSFSDGALSPYWVGALRLGVAALFFLVCAGSINGLPHLARQLAGLDWRRAAWAGACMAGYNLTFFAGVKATGVAVGTALAIGSGPIWAGLLQLAGGARPGPGWWAGTLLAVGGGVLLVFGRGGDIQADPPGIALCLASGLTYALYALLNKKLVRHSTPAVATLGVFLVGALLALPAAGFWAGPPQITVSGWLVVGFLGIASTGIAYLLFSTGLRDISAATGVSLALMEPVTAFLLALAVVGERPGAPAYAGLAALLAGLALVIRAETR
ncbi:DMT family transporter [Castellaniella denitrificans]|uniref:EamA family transporter n=1 Tax=Castellaniella denitrificans TaxID=56119 RepID=A0ABT4M3L9_9BURK|nr:EamA family transporter [Castellaniella denitrificans]MCZ4329881.1 EamA family transporter [Castellaniella denitrificans]